MSEHIPLTPEAIADLPHPDDGTHEIASDLAYVRLAMVNIVFFGKPARRRPPMGAHRCGHAGYGGQDRARRGRTIWGRRAAGGDRHDARPFRSCGLSGEARGEMGCAGLRARFGASVSQWLGVISATRSLCGRRNHAAPCAALSTQPRRCAALAETAARGWKRALDAGLAMAAYARPFARPRFALERSGPRDDRGGCVHHHKSGVRLFRRGPGAGNARASQVFHAGLGLGRKIGQ